MSPPPLPYMQTLKYLTLNLYDILLAGTELTSAKLTLHKHVTRYM